MSLTYIGYQPNGQASISSMDRGIKPVTLHNDTIEEYSPPRRLRTEEIPHIVNDFKIAARNAIEAGNLYTLAPVFLHLVLLL